MSQFAMLLLTMGFMVVLLLGMCAFLVAKCFRRVRANEALIVNKAQGEPVVTFTSAIVFPVIHRAEVMDLGPKSVIIERQGREGLMCRDGIRAEVRVRFIVRVPATREAVLQVSRTIGCGRLADPRLRRELFHARFVEALKTAANSQDFEELIVHRERFREGVVTAVGQSLNGFVLDEVVLESIGLTPIEQLDPTNLLDAKGIEKVRARRDFYEALGWKA